MLCMFSIDLHSDENESPSGCPQLIPLYGFMSEKNLYENDDENIIGRCICRR